MYYYKTKSHLRHLYSGFPIPSKRQCPSGIADLFVYIYYVLDYKEISLQRTITT